MAQYSAHTLMLCYTFRMHNNTKGSIGAYILRIIYYDVEQLNGKNNDRISGGAVAPPDGLILTKYMTNVHVLACYSFGLRYCCCWWLSLSSVIVIVVVWGF